MSKCAIVGKKAIQALIARYEGIGKPLTNDEREILLFHLYNELRDNSEQRIKRAMER